MADFNKVILAGHLTKIPDVRTFKMNITVASSGIAVNRKYKDKEEVMFIDIVVYGKLAETFGQYTAKGSAVLIEGRLSFRQWEQDGQKRSKHEVIVESLRLLGNKLADNNTTADKKQTNTAEKEERVITDEDVPF